ncbi:MAG: hypothetical protein OEY18_01715 [Candidatus Aminicenantes bacterium]|nr:hypothetical protein [Candidatus Aminicenantes bacterium]MDH5383396.1 hypothetical protein [Candidatus Aminicenantes bacterium]MDH5743343.1 hypothetical protein [Candidatus Aminicenantes bacterium]
MKFKLPSTVFLVISCFLLLSSSLSAQSLFEKTTGSKEEKPYELNGYLRGTFYVGKVPDKNDAEIKSGYGEASMKLRVRKQDFGDAFAEVRFRRGHEFRKNITEINLREAYVNAYLGSFDFRIGHQIVVWGRADGWNPTDNITPRNMLIRSPDEDDRRLANFLIRSYYNRHPLRFEVIWVPSYSPSYIPTDLISFPPGMTLGDPVYPDSKLKNSAFAFRLNLEFPSIDGSISYFNGHNPLPGITADLPKILTNEVILNVFHKSYRVHILGGDFSTVVAGSFGLRGELAFRIPHKDYKEHLHVPNPDLQYVVGIDKELVENFSVILQYIGRYVFDFSELEEPSTPFERLRYVIALKNRLITFQQYDLSHSFSCRAAWDLLNETMTIEAFGMVNFTSNEVLFRPKMSYDIADALTFTLGVELYSGPDDTLFELIDSTLNAVFMELKASF